MLKNRDDLLAERGAERTDGIGIGIGDSDSNSDSDGDGQFARRSGYLACFNPAQPCFAFRVPRSRKAVTVLRAAAGGGGGRGVGFYVCIDVGIGCSSSFSA